MELPHNSCVEREQLQNAACAILLRNKKMTSGRVEGDIYLSIANNLQYCTFLTLRRFLAQPCERRADIRRTFATFIDLNGCGPRSFLSDLGYSEDERCHLRNVSAILPMNSTS
jgi:hypothetical protein